MTSPSAPINRNHRQHQRECCAARPLPGVLWVTGLLELEETASDSSYNSLQASVTQRFHHGLRFLGVVYLVQVAGRYFGRRN